MILENRLLKQFKVVAEEGSVRSAARRLCMSQPPLSQAIQKLETSLNVVLFERRKKRLYLTDAGALLLEEARNIEHVVSRAETRLLASVGRAPPMRIGYVSAAIFNFVPEALKRLRAKNAPMPQLIEMSSSDQYEALLKGAIDIACVHEGFAPPDGYASQLIAKDTFRAAVHVSHPLAKRSTLLPADLVDERLVLFPRVQSPSVYDAIRNKIIAVGGAAEVSTEAGRIFSQFALVSAGVGIGFVSASTAANVEVTNVRTLEFSKEEPVPLELYVIARPELLESFGSDHD